MIYLETDAPVTLHSRTGPRATPKKGKPLAAGVHKVPKHKHGYTVKGEATVTIRVPAGAENGVIAQTRYGRDQVDVFEVLPDMSGDQDISRARSVQLSGGLKLSFFETARR